MQRTERTHRAGLIAALLATSCLGLATPAAAEAGLQWHRQLGTSANESANSVATDAAGNLLWTQQIGTPKEDTARGVTTFSTGGAHCVYVAGGTTGSLCGANRGDQDAFVAKYAAVP